MKSQAACKICVSASLHMFTSNPVDPTIIIPWTKHPCTTITSCNHRHSQASVCLPHRATCGFSSTSHIQCPSKSHCVLPAGLSEGFVWGHCVSWAMLLMPDLTLLNKLFHSRERPVMLFQLFSYTQMYPFNYDKSLLQWPSHMYSHVLQANTITPSSDAERWSSHTSERAGRFYKCSFSCFYTMCDNGKDLLLLLTTTGWKAIFILSDISPLV